MKKVKALQYSLMHSSIFTIILTNKLSFCWLTSVIEHEKVKLSLHNSLFIITLLILGERGGLVVEPRTPEREVGGWITTSAMLCP